MENNVITQNIDADLELIDNVRDYKNSTFITEHYYVRLKSGSIKVKKL